MSERAAPSESVLWGDADDAEALRRCRALVNAVDDGVYQLDPDGRFVAVNDAVVETTGYDREDLLGEHVSLLLDDAAVRAIEREIERRLAGRGEDAGASELDAYPVPSESDESFEVAVETASGERLPCELRFSLLVEDGRFEGTVGVVRDVADRERAERALAAHRERERELERYETLFTESGDVNAVLNPDGTFQFLPPSTETVLGYDPDDLLGEDAFQYVHPDDRERAWQVFADLVEDPDAEPTVEFRYRHADGSWLVLEVHARNLLDDPSIRGIVAYTRDVTERTERERELERYEAIVEAVNDGVYVVDGDGRFTMVNDAYADLVGYDREELVGEHVSLVADEDVRRRAQAVEATLRDDAETDPPVVEAELETASGDRVPTETTFALLPGSDDHRVGVVRDLTERKERQRALEERERQLSTLMDNVPGMVYRCRNEPGWPMEFVSDACEEVTGYDAGAVERGEVGWGDDVMVEADREEVRERVQSAVGDGETFTETYRIETADGDRRWVRDHGRGIENEDGEVVAIEGIVSDVTERKRLEAELDEVFGRVTDAFYALDDRWQFTHANERAEELVDYRDEGLVGRDFWEVFERAADSELGEEYREAMATQEPTSFEFYYPDPLAAWYEVRAYPSETGLSVYFRDVTDRKRFEDALAALHDNSRGLFRASSAEEVADLAVEAGTEVLELSDVAFYLADEDSGDLVPAAKATEEGFMWENLPQIPPDDSTIAGHAFAAGEAVVWDDVRESPNVMTTETDMRSGVFVPVADHGVIFAGSTAVDAFDERTRQLLELLAANAEAALDRVERERKLEESERRYRTLTEHFPNGIVTLFDHDLRYTLAAGRGFDRIPVEPDDLEGTRFRDVWDDDTADALEPALEATLDGSERSVELEYVGREWVVHAVPITDERGDVFAGMTMAQDVTESRERERRLERYRAFTDAVLDAIDDVFYILDESGRLQRWNDALLEVTGYGPDEVATMHAVEFFGEEEHHRIADAVREGFETGSVQVEADLLTRGGDRVPFEFAASALEDPEGDRVLAGIGRDVSERKEHERRLEDTIAKLEESNERLESFASMLAHELRNPVTIGQIYGQQLPDEAAPEAVEYVTEAFDRIEDMIDVMLVLTRGREAVGERTPLSVPEVAREAWDSVEAPDATLSVEVDAGMAADETYVRHLFRNLFENAVQHGGADVTVRVDETDDGFYVADDGAGIPPDERDDVFEAGFTTAGDEGGTGLGLAFVEKLAEVYDWTCSVRESESGGARFEFRNVDLESQSGGSG